MSKLLEPRFLEHRLQDEYHAALSAALSVAGDIGESSQCRCIGYVRRDDGGCAPRGRDADGISAIRPADEERVIRSVLEERPRLLMARQGRLFPRLDQGHGRRIRDGCGVVRPRSQERLEPVSRLGRPAEHGQALGRCHDKGLGTVQDGEVVHAPRLRPLAHEGDRGIPSNDRSIPPSLAEGTRDQVRANP